MDNQQRAQAAQLYARQLQGESLESLEKKLVADWREFEFRDFGSAIPKVLFAEMAKLHITTMANHETNYGLPVGRKRKAISLDEVLQWIGDTLKQHGKAIRSGSGEAKADKQDRSARKEELELKKVELHIQTMQAKLQSITENAIPISQVEELFKWWQSELRKLGERIGKRFGADAQTLFNGSLDRIARHMEGEVK